jgi:ATP-dependent DNA helicase RecQ
LKHDKLSTYGIGDAESQEYWGGILRHLVHQGYLSQDVGNYSVLKLTEAALPLLRGEKQFQMARPRVRKAPELKDKIRGLDELQYDTDLFDVLRSMRKEIADRAGVPPFVIFHDRTLAELAAHRPESLDDLLEIHGVGKSKCEKYGDEILETVKSFNEGFLDKT